MKRILFVFAILSAVLFHACASRQKVSNAAFGKYVSGFTSGKVNADEEIKIELTQAIIDSMKLEKTDTAALKKCVSISPSIKGRFYWKNEKTIAFKPESRYADGLKYHVELKLNKLADVPSDFKTFDFFFDTEHEKFEVSPNSLSAYDAYNIEWQYYEVVVRTNIQLSKDSILSCFTANQNGHKLPVRCIDNGSRSYRIIADSIRRGDAPTEILLKWNTEKIGGDISGEKLVQVKALGDYTVTAMEVKDDGDQKLKITFTDPILTNQNFDGLIIVEDAAKMQFSVSGNVVTVFLPERVEGSKKITINKGLLNFRNHKMKESTSGVVEFQGPRPALRVNKKGSILPNSQGLLFPFESIGIHSVDVRIIKIKEEDIHQFLQVNELDGYDEMSRVGKIVIEKTINLIADTVTPQNQWTTHILDLGKLISPEPGSIYRVCIRYKKKYTFLDCRNQANDSDNEYLYQSESAKDTDWSEYGWHGEGFDGYNTWRNDDEDPCSDYYYRGGAISKNILASDIGVIYQEQADKTGRIVTTNLLTGAALPNTEVSLYAYTQEKIAEGTTDEQGMLQLSLSQKPFLLVARKEKQRAYLKLTNANTLSVSKFNVEGQDQSNGLKGFLYAERGVWRPGDSVYLHLALNDQSSPLPDKHPIHFELQDPEGKTIFKRTTTEHLGHIYPLYFQTSDNAPMGVYTAKVTVGNAVFYKNMLLEFIVPNRMKLLTNVDDKILTAKDSVVEVKVNWLNGAIGKGLKTQASMSLKPDWSYFTKYNEYSFIAPYNQNFRSSFELKEATTDDSGVARFTQPRLQLSDAPGIVSVSYILKAYEQGGGFSNDKATATLSVFDSYIGLKMPDGDAYSGSLDYAKQYSFPYVVVNKDQQKVNGHQLQLKIYEMQYQRWYEADRNDVTSFRTHNAKICVRDTTWVAATGEGSFKFGDIGKQYGRYMIVLKDLASGHETGALVTFDNPYWDRNSNEDADFESIVQLSTDKKKYKAGDAIQLTIPGVDNAKVLVNIESDSKILQQFWVDGNTTRKPISIKTTADMAPGIYIHATVLQPHHYTKDGAPIRQYGIIPVQIDNPEAKLEPVISIKKEVRPDVNNTITISEQQGKEMYYSLVLVDEGLLDLTHFKTPDIWQYMNAQRSLKIKTWDMYNQVIGAYSGKIQNVFSIGGDGGYEETEPTKANRFKPAIINLGVFHLTKGGKQQHQFNVPNYFGSMKAFVVAYNKDASGSASQSFFVRKPIMLLTSAPRMMSAMENYQIPVTIFNTEKKARKVAVTLTAKGLAGFNYCDKQTIAFNSDGDAVVNFGLSLPEETGILNMEIVAADGAEKSTERLEIQVKPTQPIRNHTTEQMIKPGGSYTFDLTAKGIKGTYSANLNISDRQHFDFDNQLRYLIQYPHGCVEQITSAAFAQLMLSDVQDINEEQAAEIHTNVTSVIKRLSQYQTYNGGFAYWPYHQDVNDYASVYVLHFLVKAKAKGFVIPQYLFENAVNYQKELAHKYQQSESNRYSYQEPELAQAYRLYLLAEVNMGNLAAMNKFKESNLKDELSKALLAKAYAKMGKSETATSITKNLKWDATGKDDNGYFRSPLRNNSLMLIALQQIGNTVTNEQIANNIINAVATQWNSTLATSLALVSLSDYFGNGNNSPVTFSFNGKSQTMKKHSMKMNLGKNNTGKVSLQNTSKRNIYVVANEYYSSKNQNEPLVNNGMKLKITYVDAQRKSMDVNSLLHGANFNAKIEVSNTTDKAMQQVALEYYIANGWQIISNRYADDASLNSSSTADFTDFRDDRANYFFNLTANETKTFYVTLNASYKGKFYQPIAQCYPMYNERYKAQVAGKWVEVK